MKYLLDTCAISETIRPRPDQNFLDWFCVQEEKNLFLSLITLGELYKGAFKVQDIKRQEALLIWINSNLKSRFRNRIIPFSDAVMATWGKLNGENEKNGKKLSVIDSLIAATAINHELIVVTRNEKDFFGSALKLFNPWQKH